MNKLKLQIASVDELVQRFEAIAVSQDKAVLGLRTATYNRLYRDMEAVRQELKSRSGDQRRALTPLLASDNAQVRLKAAISLLGIFPEPARQTLQAISNDKFLPQRIDAGFILQGLADGSFMPN